jgi:hypothetical protein
MSETTDEDVLEYRKPPNEVELLVDHPDATPMGAKVGAG